MPIAWLLACAAFLVAWSWVRLLASGQPSPDLEALRFPLDWLGAAGFVAAVLLSARAHLRRVGQAAVGAAAVRETSREAFALALLAGAMLPLLSSDLFSVLAYAELLSKPTLEPFTLPPPGLGGSSFMPFLGPRWREAPCVYGPLQLFFWWPAAALAARLPAALAVAKLLEVAAAAGTLALVRRECSRPEGPGPAAFAAVALSPVLWIEGAGQAHNDVVVGLLFAAWLVAARRSQVLVACALLGAAVASKLTAALPAFMYLAHLAGRPDAAGSPGARSRGRERDRACRRARVRALLERHRNAERASGVPGGAHADEQPRGDRLRGAASVPGSRRRDRRARGARHATDRRARAPGGGCGVADQRRGVAGGLDGGGVAARGDARRPPSSTRGT
jgi:hypothetical protein